MLTAPEIAMLVKYQPFHDTIDLDRFPNSPVWYLDNIGKSHFAFLVEVAIRQNHYRNPLKIIQYFVKNPICSFNY
jgi:hypothetical protein